MNFWNNADPNQIVCYCIGVNKQTLVDAINKGCNSLSEIKEITLACTGNRCKELNPSGKCCSVDIKILIELYGIPEPGCSDNTKGGCCCGGEGDVGSE